MTKKTKSAETKRAETTATATSGSVSDHANPAIAPAIAPDGAGETIKPKSQPPAGASAGGQREPALRGLALAVCLLISGVTIGFTPGASTPGLATDDGVSDPVAAEPAASAEAMAADEEEGARFAMPMQIAQRPGVVPAVPQDPAPEATIHLPDGVRHLSNHFQRVNYDLSAVQSGEILVPRVYTAALPSDLPEVSEVEKRKDMFLRILLPLVLKVNEGVLETRERLQMLQDELARGYELDDADAAWLAEVAERYGVEDPRDFGALLVRVDAAPVSLALVQAIQESGWGTSRFARDGNALFGQRTWSEATPGFEPTAVDDPDFRVRAFSDLADTVRAYVRNLNTGGAYQAFREQRAAMRAEGREVLDGYELAGTLTAYSEEGQLYIEKLRALMRQNDLQSFDTAQLSGDGLPHNLVPDETIGHTQLADQSPE